MKVETDEEKIVSDAKRKKRKKEQEIEREKIRLADIEKNKNNHEWLNEKYYGAGASACVRPTERAELGAKGLYSRWKPGFKWDFHKVQTTPYTIILKTDKMERQMRRNGAWFTYKFYCYYNTKTQSVEKVTSTAP